jgi:hypothetical protein
VDTKALNKSAPVVFFTNLSNSFSASRKASPSELFLADSDNFSYSDLNCCNLLYYSSYKEVPTPSLTA